MRSGHLATISLWHAFLPLAAYPIALWWFAVQILESEDQHTRARRSYAEFNALLTHAHSEGFFVRLNTFKSHDVMACYEITSAKELLRLADKLFNHFYNRHAGIHDLNEASDVILGFSILEAAGQTSIVDAMTGFSY